MTNSADRENALTLARALGIQPPRAEQLLTAHVLVTTSDRSCDAACGRLAESLLSRTFASVGQFLTDVGIEVVVGDVPPRTSARAVFVKLDGNVAIVDHARHAGSPSAESPPILLLLAACYAAGAATRLLAGDGIAPARYPIRIDLGALLGEDVAALTARADAQQTYLAGAGAIGNSFLLGLSCFDAVGTVHVVDPDTVSGGNLNRCHFFRPEDVGEPKAAVLCGRAAGLLPNVRLLPFASRLQNAPGKDRMERLVVAVDSRRARRELQEEIPKQVFDASTTGIKEIVVHFNDRTISGACMSCVYRLERDEEAHERHVAAALGVTVEDVREKYIDVDVARRIRAKYPAITTRIEGEAYDSLFKSLCGQQLLHTSGGEQVIAPFAFVSVLAGALLALEFVRRLARGNAVVPFNYWRLSPWAEPVLQLRQLRPNVASCCFCGNPILQEASAALWGSQR